MKTIRDILAKKGTEVWVVGPDAPVFDALRYMAQKNTGALLVMDGERVLGILSERDYARKVILKGRSSKDTPVRDIMTERVLFVRPDNTVEETMALMTDKRIRHLPVMESGKVAGIISIGDLVKALVEEQKFMIEQLEQYIQLRW
ncbi:CBS domain-containing protein [bacterium]|nr:CBS domain-containing protein [bacterium]